jgi:hypothetical protein
MTRSTIHFRTALVSVLCTAPLAAQEHQHPAGAEQLGRVHFAQSCSPAVTPQFDRAVALLHSFEFGGAIEAFTGVLATDSTCAMAQWGIALSRWGNPMATGNRTAMALEQGRHSAETASRLGAHATERERGYIGAVSQLFDDVQHRDQRTRVVAYERAMGNLVERQPADTEAMIFYAIALVASAPPQDKTYANQLKAGAMLETLWAAQPDHPGLAHYINHAYDVPALAGRATIAARRYAAIAPSAAHALHMPSHTFTRVGMWHESIETNMRSIETARRTGAIAEALHASDYAEYANLQLRRDSAAEAIVRDADAFGKVLDVNATTGAANGPAGAFAVAAIPARYAIERRDWAAASALQPRAGGYPHTEAMTWFVVALGAAHTGQPQRARAAIDSLAILRARLTSTGEGYWAEQVAIQQLAAQGWLDLAEHRPDDALSHMREAATREDATEKSAVTPGPLAPARELLGDMLMELKRPADALEQYRLSLRKEPNRFRTLYGAMTAAAASGDQAARASYAAQIQTLTGS